MITPQNRLEKLVITKKEVQRNLLYNICFLPRIRLDVDVYEQIVDIADSTQRSVKEVACILLRYAMEHTEVQV